jgi:magnesium transporter
MNVKLRPEKYLRYLYPPNLFATKQRTKEILSANPTVIPHREEAKDVIVTVFDGCTKIDNRWRLFYV